MENSYEKAPVGSTHRMRIGLQLKYLQPKLNTEEIMFTLDDDCIANTYNNNNQEHLPKFKSIPQLSQKVISTSIQYKQKIRSFLHNDYIKKINMPQQYLLKQKKHHKLQLITTIIIWICYLISGLSNQIGTFGAYSIINVIGILLAFVYSIFQIYKKKQVKVDIVLHSLSLVLTVVNHLYKSESEEDKFLLIMWGVRNVRLLFIINYIYEFKQFVIYYSKEVLEIIKLMPSWIVLIVVFSLITTNSSGFAYYNRCTHPSVTLQAFTKSQVKMCGMRANQCSEGMACSNPFSYDIKPNDSFSNAYELGFGSFSYINIFYSFFTNMGSVFLANSSKIVKMYSNAIPLFYIVCINIIMILFSYFYLFPILLVLLKRQFKELIINKQYWLYQKQPQIQRDDLKRNESSSNQVKTQILQGSNNIKIMNQSQIKDGQFTSSNIVINNGGGTGISRSTQGNLPKINIKPQIDGKTKKRPQMKPAVVKNYTYFVVKYIIWIFIAAICITHFSLALSYSIKSQKDEQRGLIGICLLVFFIAWTFLVVLNVAGVYKINKSDKNTQLMCRIQAFIYVLNLFDYGYKIILGLSLQESHTIITPIATSALFFRIVYLPYIYQIVMNNNSKILKCIIRQISIMINIISVIIRYVLVIILLSIMISSFTVIITERSLVDQTIKYTKMITNTNWIQDGNLFGISPQMDLGYGILLKTILIIIGEIILMNMMTSQILTRMLIYKQEGNDPIKILQSQQQYKQQMGDKQIQNMVKQQKTFNLLTFQNALRNNLYSLINSDNYKLFRHIFIIVYLVFAWIKAAYLKNNQISSLIMLAMDIVIIVDQLFTIIALRFWGYGSFINYQIFTFVNFFSSFLIIISFPITTQLPIIHFFRLIRFTLLINYSNGLKEAKRKIETSFILFFKNISVVIILWIFLMFISMLIKMQNANGLLNSDNPFRFLQKGFDLNRQIKFQQLGQQSTMSLITSLIYFIFGIGINLYFIGIILQYLKQQKKHSYYKSMASFSKGYELDIKKMENFMKIKEEFQLHLIKQKILSISPQINLTKIDNQSIFTQIIALKYYQNVKIVIVLISIFLTLIILAGLGGKMEFSLKTAKFLMYLCEIFFWIIESISNNGTHPNFKRNLAIWIVSFPGHVFMFIPFHKIENSSALLLHIFQILGMIAPLPLTGIHGFIEHFTCSKIINFMKKKIGATLNILLLTFFITAILSTLMNIFIEKDQIYTFGMILIGIFGGTYHFQLEIQQNHNHLLIIIRMGIFFIGLIMRSTLFAHLIYQVLHQSQQCFNLHKNNQQISQLTVNKFIFDDQKFISLWQKLDPEGYGIISCKKGLNYVHQFSRCFNLAKQYIQFLVSPKNQIYNLKLSLFKNLKIPIRTASSLNKETNQKSSQYVILMHDLISSFLCFAINANVHRSSNVKDNGVLLSHQKNWLQQFKFSTQQWQDQIINKFKQNQKNRLLQQQIKKRYFLKPIEMNSWSLGILLNLLPKIRFKISQIRYKSS